MEIVDHAPEIALEIASPKHKRSSKKTKKTKKLASSSKESEAPSLQRHLEQTEPTQGESLDETASLSRDCRSCCSGSASLKHPQSHQHIGHLKREAPLSAGPSPAWRLREGFKAEPSPGSLRGIFRRKALGVIPLPDAVKIVDLNATSSPGRYQKKALDSKVKLTKDERVWAQLSQDRKKEATRSKLNSSGHSRRKLARQVEQEAAKQRVLEQAAKQQQQFAPHNRPGVAHHGAGTEVDELASCLFVDTIPAEVSFHAKGFLGEADHKDEDEDDQSMGSFASTLTPSVGSVEQEQKQLMQSSRWDMMEDSIMPLFPNGKNAPLAGWQLRERFKSSAPALDTIPDSLPAVPIRHLTKHTKETKCVAAKLPDDGDDFMGFLNASAVLSEPDCKPAAPIRQATDHDEGTKCVALKLPDEGQDFLAFLQTKVQGEKKPLDVAPISSIKCSSLRKAQARKLEAAASKPPISPPKRWVPPKKASGKGNDLPPAFSIMNASYERISSSMHSFGVVKATSSSILDCKPAVPIRQLTRHEGEKCVAPKLPDEGQDLFLYLQKGVHEETKDQPSVPTPPTKGGFSTQMEAEELNSSMTSFGSLSLGECFVKEEKKEQTPATVPASWSPKKSNGKDLPPAFHALNESFERLQSTIMRSFGDSKPAVPMRQSSHVSETCVALKIPDQGQEVVKGAKKPDSPATSPSPIKNRKALPAAFPAFNQSMESISFSSAASKGSKGKDKASPKKGWTPLKSVGLKRKSDHTVSTRTSAEKSYLVSPATAGATSEKGTASQALRHNVASRYGELLEERNKGPETSGCPGRSTPVSPHSANHKRNPKIKYQRKSVKPSTRESPVEKSDMNGSSHSRVAMDKLKNRIPRQSASDETSMHPSEDIYTYSGGPVSRLCTMFSRQSSASEPSVNQSEKNGSGHTCGSEGTLRDKASKQATSKTEPSAQLSTENSNHSPRQTPGSKIRFQKKGSRRSLKDDSDNNNETTSIHTAGSRIKLKRVSKTLDDERAKNGSSHTASSRIKLKRITKESSSDQSSLGDSADNGHSHSADSRIKLKKVSKKSSKTKCLLKNPDMARKAS